jgi:hypothetical protein
MKTEKRSVDQAKDTGLALVLILLLMIRVWKQDDLVLLAIFVLVLTMAWPAIFELPARVWFGLAELMGTVSSAILLSLVFALVVIPIAWMRRIAGADPMKRRLWKKGDDSVFLQRNHHFSAGDLENPY